MIDINKIRPPKNYLDHAASTPVAPEIMKVWEDLVTRCYLNPSAGTKHSHQLRKYIDQLTEQFLDLLEVGQEMELIFTSGGTEANNLA
ncbi:MAG: aminotransferase class V-fold PLP-dependent enzyme, partial [Lentisphaerae bacterium]